MSKQSLSPNFPYSPGGGGGGGGGGNDEAPRSGGRKRESVGEWAKLAMKIMVKGKPKVRPEDLTMQGPEKAQAGLPHLRGGKKSLKMPEWVFDNDFEGQPPLNPTEELSRMDRELTAALNEMDKLARRSTALTGTGKAKSKDGSDQAAIELRKQMDDHREAMRIADALEKQSKKGGKDQEAGKDKDT